MLFIFARSNITIFLDTRCSITESRATMGQDGSDPQFHVNFGSGRVFGLGHFSCGSGWAGSGKLDPHPTLAQLILLLQNQQLVCRHSNVTCCVVCLEPFVMTRETFATILLLLHTTPTTTTKLKVAMSA